MKNTKKAYVLVDKSSKPKVIVSPDVNDNNDNDDVVVVTNNANTLAGELTLKLSNGESMTPILAKGASRNFNIVKASETTYRIAKSYGSGTQFRIYLKSMCFVMFFK